MYFGAVDPLAAILDMGEDQLDVVFQNVLKIPPRDRTAEQSLFITEYKGIKQLGAKEQAKIKALAQIAARQAAGQGPLAPQLPRSPGVSPFVVVGGVGAAAILAFILIQRRRK